MTFPVYIRVGPFDVHPHWVFETLAYAIGFRLFLTLRKRRGDTLAYEARWWVIAAAAAGAAMGSRVLYWFEDPPLYLANWHDPGFLLGGKTIVGALISGLAAVEWTKQRLRITQRTGDLFALPLTIGTAIGRVGCFLTGTEDHTAGIHTSLPWGVNFGDGPRHPTQLYEILFLIVLTIAIEHVARRPHREGDLFKLFMISYFGFRLAVDFLKPEVRVLAGLSSIQWACVAMLMFYSPDISRWCSVGLRFKEKFSSVENVSPPAASYPPVRGKSLS
jgi:phosphatidylglycerol:prolipoprotein diacylglycerol transferase